MVSMWRVENDIPLEKLGFVMMGEKEVKKYAEKTLKMVGKLNANARKHKNPGGFRYECWKGENFDYVFHVIENAISEEIPEEKKKYIVENYSLSANRAKQQGLDSFSQAGADGVHGLHIYKGAVGGWRELVRESVHDLVEVMLREELNRWGYE